LLSIVLLNEKLNNVDAWKNLACVFPWQYGRYTFGFQYVPSQIGLHRGLGTAENANAHEGRLRRFILRLSRRLRWRAGPKSYSAIHALLGAFLIFNTTYGTVGHKSSDQ
jgi:hypothetical protein